jgi:plasmid stability protein
MPSGIYVRHSVSEETKQKISNANKGHSVSTETRNIISNKLMGRKLPLEQVEGIKKRLTGLCKENNYNWKGGISREKHGGKEYIEWRSKVYQRDNWNCQTCGQRGGGLQAHHIKSWKKYPELRYDINNGVTLCIECHKLTTNYRNKVEHNPSGYLKKVR